MIRYLLLAIPLLLVVACKSPQPVEMKGVTLQSVKPVGTDLKKVLVAATVKVSNPNPFPIKVWHTDAVCKVNGRTVSAIQVDTLIKLAPSSLTNIPIELELEISPLLSSGLSLLTGAGIPYSISGTTTAGRGGIKWNIPFEQTGTFTTKDLGQFGF
jgi:LEA14-like dessication related protein